MKGMTKMIRLQKVVLGMRFGLLAVGGSRSQAFLLPSLSSSANKIRINHSTLTRATQADSVDDDGDDTYDNGEELLPEEWPNKLENPEFKNYPVSYLKEQEEKGKLVLEPFYQRGYRWTQQQASLWMESILIGFPSIPEVMLLKTEDEDGSIRFSTFDGRQRLASIILFMRNERGDAWKATNEQKKKNLDTCFALEKLTVLTQLDGCTFKDLSTRQQNTIDNCDVRCAIIPSSWPMKAYTEFFKRIQGGGTPMSDHELRRAIARGPFTELLDDLVANSREVKEALRGYSLRPDEIQVLLLRYFILSRNFSSYGNASLTSQYLETMKSLNVEMGSWDAGEAERKRENLVRPLMDALKLLTDVFDQDKLFRRPVPLIKDGEPQTPTKVWSGNSPNQAVWECLVYCFAKTDKQFHPAIRDNHDLFRSTLMDIMQTHPLFIGDLRYQGASRRIAAMNAMLQQVLEEVNTRDFTKVPSQTRLELINEARKAEMPCPLCYHPLSRYNDHLHIDHILPRSKGGTTALQNLQVVHKTCNLRKSNKVLDQTPPQEKEKLITEKPRASGVPPQRL